MEDNPSDGSRPVTGLSATSGELLSLTTGQERAGAAVDSSFAHHLAAWTAELRPRTALSCLAVLTALVVQNILLTSQ